MTCDTVYVSGVWL